ncbi:MAG: hypothetical protein Q7J28_14245 [Caulobacter sp.]|nr:hypothetical protein [Caulobacter sp.]
MLDWIETHQALAAWVQAIGTLVALTLTVWATMHATGQAKRIAARPTEMFLLRIDRAIRNMDRFSAKMADQEFLEDVEVWTGNATVEIGALLATPLEEWPTFRLHEAVEYLLKVCSHTEDSAGIWHRDPLPTAAEIERARVDVQRGVTSVWIATRDVLRALHSAADEHHLRAMKVGFVKWRPERGLTVV